MKMPNEIYNDCKLKKVCKSSSFKTIVECDKKIKTGDNYE